MAYNVNSYFQMLMNLLPRGRALSRSPDSILYKLMHAFSFEFSLIDSRGDDLSVERNTLLTSELLADYERDLGLPDDCTELATTINERRRIINNKLVTDTGLNKQTYIDIAADLGYDITITEFTPCWCGIAECGDSIGDQNNIFYWQVNLYMSPETFDSWVYFTCGNSQCGDALIYVPLVGVLQCVLNIYKPAWTQMLLSYYGPGFSSGFSSGFNSILSDDPIWLEGGFSRGFSSGYDVYRAGGGFSIGFSDGFSKPYVG
jgi:uncharacterized protein YmfQ (DUF2313 family)